MLSGCFQVKFAGRKPDDYSTVNLLTLFSACPQSAIAEHSILPALPVDALLPTDNAGYPLYR